MNQSFSFVNFLRLQSVDSLLTRAILCDFLHVKKSGLSPLQTVDKKLFSPPRRGRIALSANERIAEFLDFAIQSKFDYVNKLYHQLC